MTSSPWLLSTLALCIASLGATLAQCGDAVALSTPSRAAPAALQDPKPSTPAPIPASADSIRLLVSGSMLGRLEPCGCASGMLGGLPRRMQHIGEQRNYDLLLEGGDLVAEATELDLLKAFTAIQVLCNMQHPYDALGVGQKDLLLPPAEWSSFLQGAPVVTTDLQGTAPDWPGRPFVEKEVRGQKVRVLSFSLQLPPALQKEGSPVQLLAPAAAWQKGLEGAPPETLRVLLVQAGDAATRAMLPRLDPKPDLVLCFDPGYTEPPAHPELLGGVPIVYPGIRGRVLLDVSLARLPEGPRAGYEIIPLQGSKTVPGGGGDPDVRQAILDHRKQVKDDEVLKKMANQRPTANGATYVGSTTCAGCHPSANTAWTASKHGHAWKTLVLAENDPKRYGWPVTAYPDCVSCHTVGYGEQSGFVTAADTPHLTDVGCERCHGAGSQHVMSGGQKPLGLIGNVAASILCSQCHDFEQSPDFVYTAKWPLIQHGREPHQVRKK